jgi:putative transcriptional regulator
MSNSKRFKLEPEISAGQILVASPLVAKNRFAGTVLLVLQNDSKHVFGVNLTQQAPEIVRATWEKITGSPQMKAHRIVTGGPVGGPVFALHPSQDMADATVAGDLYLTMNSKGLVRLAHQDDVDYRVFFGLTRYATRKLQKQIDRGIWLTFQGTADDVLADSDSIWIQSLRRCGQESLRGILGIRGFPEDPSNN